MGCKYCGAPIPPRPPAKRGAPRLYCCAKHQKRYAMLKWSRKRKGLTIEHCKNCGKVLLDGEKDYCSDNCRNKVNRTCGLQPEGINALRFAALRQAKRDHALASWALRPEFYELYPELTPEMMKGVRN